MVLPLNGKDCVSVFILHAVGDGQKGPFFETIQIEREVTGWFNPSIVKQLVYHTRWAIGNTFHRSKVVNRAEHLVGLPREGTIFEKGSEGRASLGQACFFGCRNGRLKCVFACLSDSFQQHGPGMICPHLSEGFIDLNGSTIQLDFNVPGLNRYSQISTSCVKNKIQLIDNLVLSKTIQNESVLSISKAKPT